ncbi:MAG: FGGY family carbohydrate kinase [Clostridia bacterium]|nr:FGGY family carbohydrate kinase [Clostridia bacterium]
MMGGYLIGVDIGTTGTKSMLFSPDGEALCHAYASYPLYTPENSVCEQDARDWWRATVETVRKVVSDAGCADDVAGISLSLQGGTLVPVDEKFEPLRPAIVWSDSRCSSQAARFRERFGDRYMYEKSGWNLSGGLNAMQIAWIRENEPDVFKRTRMFLSVPDYISARLTGRAVVDISDVGINQLADIRTGRYDKNILDFAGIEESQLAEIAPSCQPIGELTREAMSELGLRGKVVLSAGAHDQYAALLGAGVTGAGDVLIGTGTAWVVTALTERPDFNTGFAQSVSATKGRWGSLVSLSTGGVCLDWMLSNVAGGEGSEKISYAALNEKLNNERLQGRDGGLMFFPYFSGASYPVKDANSKASFIGLDLSHDRYDMALAIMRGVASHTAWTLEGFQGEYGRGKVKMSGGATKSPVWTQIVADTVNRPVSIPATPDLTCVGAAIMAGVGAGIFASTGEGYEAVAVSERTIEPDAKKASMYSEALEVYKARAKALKDVYNCQAMLRGDAART